MSTVYDDMNPDFSTFDEQWEPWEPDECDEFTDTIGGCDFCGAPDVRENPEPFSGKPCCDQCFNLLIGDDADAPAWRCGNALAVTPKEGT